MDDVCPIVRSFVESRRVTPRLQVAGFHQSAGNTPQSDPRWSNKPPTQDTVVAASANCKCEATPDHWQVGRAQ